MTSRSATERPAVAAPVARFASTVWRRYVDVLSGCTWTPSAWAPATRSIHGFTAARSIGGSGALIGPGDHIGGNSDRS